MNEQKRTSAGAGREQASILPFPLPEECEIWNKFVKAASRLAASRGADGPSAADWRLLLMNMESTTRAHSYQVAALTVAIGRAMELDGRDLDRLRLGALLHDIGKLVVPPAILAKPGPLSDAEWRIVRQHPTYARNMLVSVGAPKDVIDAAYSHHECWDGTGYPRRLCGTEIPLTARIVAVADVVNALSSKRTYREAWQQEAVFNHVVDHAGTQLDPTVVDAYIGLRAA